MTEGTRNPGFNMLERALLAAGVISGGTSIAAGLYYDQSPLSMEIPGVLNYAVPLTMVCAGAGMLSYLIRNAKSFLSDNSRNQD